VGRPRKHLRHLPANLQLRHGAYYFVKAGKWTRLATDYGSALVQYAALVGAPPTVTTVKDALWSAIEQGRTRKHKKPLSEATLTGYRRSAARLAPVFGHLALADLDANMVARYVIELGTVQANRDRALLSIAYTHARIMHGYKGDDPTKRLQLRNEETPRDRYVTDAELDAIIAKASPKLGCIARFIELTGMRQGDALRVRLDDLDDAGFTYWNSKSKKRQALEWSDELTAVVEDAKRLWRRFGREHLFESRPKGKHAARGPGPYTPSGLRALWRVARAKAGLPDVRLHDLRAKAGSDAQSEGDAQRLLGHADGKVTRRHYRRKIERVKPTR
jgi:integrase